MTLVGNLGRFILAMVLYVGMTLAGGANDMLIDDFRTQPEQRWRYFADTVMGGVSTGTVRFLSEDGDSFARMTGRVSTANNGGFIQMRIDLREAPARDSQGIRLIVRGNDQRYYLHLRTSGTMLPWQYYQGGFDVTGRWTEFRLPFTAFQASGRMLRRTPKPESIRSIGVVAYGRDHDAAIDVLEIGLY